MKMKIVMVLTFVTIIVLIRYFKLDSYFTFENLKAQKDVLLDFSIQNYTFSIVLFISTYLLSVAFMLPISTLLTLTAGFLFGSIFGVLFVNIGATFGAIAAFLFARYILGDKIQKKYNKQLSKFNKELEANKYQYLFSLRFLPIFPFFLVNFLCGVTKLDIKTFVITTTLGIIPASFVFTYAGSQLATINSLGDVFTKEILFAFILLGILTLTPLIVKKIKGKNNENTTS